MSRGHHWKLETWIALLVLGMASACGSPIFAAELEVDQLIERLRKQILAAEQRARQNPLFGVKEVKLHISYAIEEKGEGSFKAFVITVGASVSAHAVQTMEITLAPIKDLQVHTPGAKRSPTILVDLRKNREYTAEELAGLLFAKAEVGVSTRGIGPSSPAREPQRELRPPSVILNVSFEQGSSEIPPRYFSELDKLGQLLRSPPFQDYRIQIEGHTDSIGPDAYNRMLSQRRAESAKRYLVEKFSIDPDRLVARGFGETRPIASNETPEGRAQNRRLEVVNLGKG
jgi:outer membrane protein OmpA-like peptidoglycan-associated protein